MTRFKVGDDVFADLYSHGQGSFAEYVCARERAFLPIPPGMSFEVAATLPHSAILAIQGLRAPGGRTVEPGDRVLIDGASGNVGPFAVQIAKSMGAEVTGVCRTGKVDFVRSLGADHVLDYTEVDYTRTGEKYDWIVDTDSHHSLFRVDARFDRTAPTSRSEGTLARSSRRCWSGRCVSVASDRLSGLLLWWKPFQADDIATLATLIAGGKVTPAIDRRYPLTEVVDALRWVDEGHARGKVLVLP